MSDFAPLDEALDGLLQNIAGGNRSRLAAAIGTDVRAANAQRLRANVQPDGAAMIPRKARPKSARDRAGAMFQRAAGANWLTKRVTDEAVEVGFGGASARLMGVHHYGLRDRVSREPGAPETTYPARAVIGLSADDRLRLLDKTLAHIAE